ncbi:HAD family hydrolase [Mycoplasma simbae]|uniref:HAD family hydrolase n=1 Tax=Mycoplasma simbae TaxID=36744 RepID=UPI0004964B69|nr:HAD family hydrolase [Mycoplasma simbae]
MHKLFAFDLDGTLFVKANLMHEQTPLALLNAKQNGHHNIISTGRSLSNTILALGDNIDLFTYIVASNGSVIYDVASKQIHIIGKVNHAVFDILWASAEQNHFIIRIDTPLDSKSYLDINRLPEWLKLQNSMDISKFKVCDESEFKAFKFANQEQIVQLALRGPKDIIWSEYNRLNSLIGDEYEVKYTNQIYIDVNAKNVNKWSGVEFVAKALNIEHKNVYTFGDSGNDIEMLSHAGVGVAMGNATAEAREAADIIIGDNTTNAIATTIESLI